MIFSHKNHNENLCQGMFFKRAGYTLANALFGCNVPSLDPKGYGSEFPELVYSY